MEYNRLSETLVTILTSLSHDNYVTYIGFNNLTSTLLTIPNPYAFHNIHKYTVLQLKNQLRLLTSLQPSSLQALSTLWNWGLYIVGALSGFFQSFPFWFPLLFFCTFLSLLLLTNQAPMISIKGGTGIVFVLSLISEDIHCIRQVFVFILEFYKLRISAVPTISYQLLSFE